MIGGRRGCIMCLTASLVGGSGSAMSTASTALHTRATPHTAWAKASSPLVSACSF